MTTLSPSPAAFDVRSEVESLRSYRLWFLILGIAMVAIGTFAIGWACIADGHRDGDLAVRFSDARRAASPKSSIRSGSAGGAACSFTC